MMDRRCWPTTGSKIRLTTRILSMAYFGGKGIATDDDSNVTRSKTFISGLSGVTGVNRRWGTIRRCLCEWDSYDTGGQYGYDGARRTTVERRSYKWWDSRSSGSGLCFGDEYRNCPRVSNRSGNPGSSNIWGKAGIGRSTVYSMGYTPGSQSAIYCRPASERFQGCLSHEKYLYLIVGVYRLDRAGFHHGD